MVYWLANTASRQRRPYTDEHRWYQMLCLRQVCPRVISLMLLTENQRERQILKMAFEQYHIKPVLTEPSYACYLKALQYVPDVIIMEMPRLNVDQLHFARMMRQHQKTRLIPIIAYGNSVDARLKRGMTKNGVSHYLCRPLKFSILMSTIKERLHQLNKSLDDEIGEKRKSDKETDTELILDSRTLPRKKIELMAKHVSGLMAFPFTIAKVLHLTQDPDAGAADLAKIMSSDPIIATNILKVANSVFFASANRRISSIKDAIVRIGFRETKRIVMGMAVMQLFDRESNNRGFDRIDFWYHSLASALLAEKVAGRIGHINSEEAFLAGLLSDFGVLLLDEFYPSILEKIIAAATDSGSTFEEAESKVMGISQRDLVVELFERWKLPETTIDAVASQHTMLSGTPEPDSRGKQAGMCVAVGNALAKAYGVIEICDQCLSPIPDSVFQHVRMPAGPPARMCEDLHRDMELYRQFFRLEERFNQKKSSPPSGGKPLEIGFVDPAGRIFPGVDTYLLSQGHSVLRMKDPASYGDYDGKVDLLLVWADEVPTQETLEPLCNIIQRHDGGYSGDEAPPSAPVLVLISDGALESLKGEQIEGVGLINQHGDVRLLDANIRSVMDGEELIAPARLKGAPAVESGDSNQPQDPAPDDGGEGG